MNFKKLRRKRINPHAPNGIPSDTWLYFPSHALLAPIRKKWILRWDFSLPNMLASLKFLPNHKTLQVPYASKADSGWKSFHSQLLVLSIVVLLSYGEFKTPRNLFFFTPPCQGTQSNPQSGWNHWFLESWPEFWLF